MKEIVSSVFKKIVESKIPESQLKPYNPFAVCNTSVGTKKTKKRERCIRHLKEKNEESNSCSGGEKKDKAASITTEKPVWSPNALLPHEEDQFVEDTQGTRLHRSPKKKHRPLTWEELEKRMQEIQVAPRDLVASANRSLVIKAKPKCKICSK